MDIKGHQGSAAGKQIPMAEISFVTVNHSDPLSFPNGLDDGNAPVEIAAMLLSELIDRTLVAVRSGAIVNDHAENRSKMMAKPYLHWAGEEHQFDGYAGKPFAIRRVDIVAWSYGGVITRWYLNQTSHAESKRWYHYKFEYVKNTPDGEIIYDNNNLPDVIYAGDVRKVITLGSMWRGVPGCNYANEAIFNNTGFGEAPTSLLFPWKLWLKTINSAVIYVDQVHDLTHDNQALRFMVPSMEVMAVESKWMRLLIYGRIDDTDDENLHEAHPFHHDVAYLAIVGNDAKYPILPGQLAGIRRDLFSDLNTIQVPSWFPYLPLEQRMEDHDGYSDGIVPFWSQAIPGSYEWVYIPHNLYASDSKTQKCVVLWLNHAGYSGSLEGKNGIKIGTRLNSIWNDTTAWDNNETAVEASDRSIRWEFVQSCMAPYPQSELYKQVAGQGRLSPEAVGLNQIKDLHIHDIGKEGFTATWSTLIRLKGESLAVYKKMGNEEAQVGIYDRQLDDDSTLHRWHLSVPIELETTYFVKAFSRYEQPGGARIDLTSDAIQFQLE